MFKWFVSLLLIGLTGCVAQNDLSQRTLTNEQVVRSSGNASEIIRLYKQQLQKEEDDQVRQKLIASYLQINDYESAQFYLTPLLSKHPHDGEINKLAGQAALGLGKFEQAHSYLTQAYNVMPEDAQLLNLVGILYSVQGQFPEARRWFERSRNAMADDATVKNNLSILDLLDNDYESARDRLESLRAKERLQEKAKVTLSIAYAKLGLFKPFRQLVPNMTTEESAILFQQLKTLDMHAVNSYAQ